MGKTPVGRARMVGKAMPTPRGTSDERAPRPAATRTRSTSSPAAGTRAKPGAHEDGPAQAASWLIDQRILDLGGWRGETLARMRALILQADPEAIEEWKWMGTPVWSHHGIVCTGEAYAKVVKLTFARGATLPDPVHLFNASLEGNTRRAIDIHEGETVDAAAFRALVQAAVARNGLPAKRRPLRSSRRGTSPSR